MGKPRANKVKKALALAEAADKAKEAAAVRRSEEEKSLALPVLNNYASYPPKSANRAFPMRVRAKYPAGDDDVSLTAVVQFYHAPGEESSWIARVHDPKIRRVKTYVGTLVIDELHVITLTDEQAVLLHLAFRARLWNERAIWNENFDLDIGHMLALKNKAHHFLDRGNLDALWPTCREIAQTIYKSDHDGLIPAWTTSERMDIFERSEVVKEAIREGKQNYFLYRGFPDSYKLPTKYATSTKISGKTVDLHEDSKGLSSKHLAASDQLDSESKYVQKPDHDSEKPLNQELHTNDSQKGDFDLQSKSNVVDAAGTSTKATEIAQHGTKKIGDRETQGYEGSGSNGETQDVGKTKQSGEKQPVESASAGEDDQTIDQRPTKKHSQGSAEKHDQDSTEKHHQLSLPDKDHLLDSFPPSLDIEKLPFIVQVPVPFGFWKAQYKPNYKLIKNPFLEANRTDPSIEDEPEEEPETTKQIEANKETKVGEQTESIIQGESSKHGELGETASSSTLKYSNQSGLTKSQKKNQKRKANKMQEKSTELLNDCQHSTADGTSTPTITEALKQAESTSITAVHDGAITLEGNNEPEKEETNNTLESSAQKQKPKKKNRNKSKNKMKTALLEQKFDFQGDEAFVQDQVLVRGEEMLLRISYLGLTEMLLGLAEVVKEVGVDRVNRGILIYPIDEGWAIV